MKVVVIGAGIAGAAAARALHGAGHTPIVLEAIHQIGGRTRTVTQDGFDGFLIDSGAIFVMGSYARTLQFLKQSGHVGEMRRWQARTVVLDDAGNRHLCRLDQPWTLIGAPSLTWRDRIRLTRRVGRLAAGPNIAPFDIDALAAADDGRTLADWARANLGERGLEYGLRPLMDPLTGADPATISSSFTRALMTQVKRTQLTVPIGGVGSIATWLLEGVNDVRLENPATRLSYDENGVTVLTPTGEITADAAIVATDAIRAHELLNGVIDPSITRSLGAVVPIAAHHVVLGYRRDPWPHSPYDLVVHAAPGPHENLGVLLNGRRAPHSVPAGGQTVSAWFDQQTVGRDPEHAIELACRAVDTAFGTAEPDFVRVFTMDLALIAPVPGHYATMRATRDSMPPRIRLAGDFLTHSGIEGALLSGERAAHDLAALAHDRRAVSPAQAAPSTTTHTT